MESQVLRFGSWCFRPRGRLAQRESIGLTSRGPQVQILYRPPALVNGKWLMVEGKRSGPDRGTINYLLLTID